MKNNINQKVRFTTLVNPESLTKIKLISYFTNSTISIIVDESFNYFYWFICRKTGELYFLNLIIDNREFQLSKDMIQALSEVNRYVFKQINFEIGEVDSINNPSQYIYTLTVGPSDNKSFNDGIF